jgi:hypothetical protein
MQELCQKLLLLVTLRVLYAMGDSVGFLEGETEDVVGFFERNESAVSTDGGDRSWDWLL